MARVTTGEPSVPNWMCRPLKSAWRWWFAAATIVVVTLIGSGLWIRWASERVRDSAKVEVSHAIAWQDRFEGGPKPASNVTVILRTPYHRPYADAEVFIETWADDLGSNLLIRDLHPKPSSGVYAWGFRVMDDLGGFGTEPIPSIMPPIASPTPSEIAWTVGSPVGPSSGAKSMRLKGFVRYYEGQNKQSVRIPASQLRQETVFRIGETECTAQYGETQGGGGVYLHQLECQTPILSVTFVDDKGNSIRSQESNGRWRSKGEKRLPRIDEPVVCTYRVDCPLISRFDAMLVEYWSQSQVRVISFDVTLPLVRQTAQGVATLPAGPWRVMPSAESRSCVERIPEDAWGPLASGNPADLFEVVVDEDYSRSGYGTTLKVKSKSSTIVASYDVTITAVRDSVDNVMFPPAGPARSALVQYWGVEVDRSGNSVWGPGEAARTQPPPDPWFLFKTRESASAKSSSIEIEGTVKLKVADTLTTAEVSGSPIDGGRTYSIGPVELFTGLYQGHLLALHFRGDPGLVRELAFLGPNGEISYSRRRTRIAAYTNNVSEFGGGEVDAAKFHAVNRVRAEYYTKFCHYVLPFKVTVPLKKED